MNFNYLFYFRAIGYIPSTLIYPALTFFFLSVCISYWAVVALYPLLTDFFKPQVHTITQKLGVYIPFHPGKTRNILKISLKWWWWWWWWWWWRLLSFKKVNQLNFPSNRSYGRFYFIFTYDTSPLQYLKRKKKLFYILLLLGGHSL